MNFTTPAKIDLSPVKSISKCLLHQLLIILKIKLLQQTKFFKQKLLHILVLELLVFRSKHRVLEKYYLGWYQIRFVCFAPIVTQSVLYYLMSRQDHMIRNMLMANQLNDAKLKSPTKDQIYIFRNNKVFCYIHIINFCQY